MICPVNCKSVFHNQLYHYIDFVEVCINWRKTGSDINGKLGLSTPFSMFEWLELSGVVEVYMVVPADKLILDISFNNDDSNKSPETM
jgi:hypothetical protein